MGTPLEAVARPRGLAHAVVTFYVGVNLLTRLDPDRARTALFEGLTAAAPLLAALARR